MNKFYIVCDYREKFKSYINGNKIYNDHISKISLDNLINAIHSCGYEADYFGGVDRLIEYYHKKIQMPNGLYINLNDGLEQKHKRGQTPILLELLKVPYSGPDAFNTLLASDKYFTKIALKSIGVSCPDSILIRKNKSNEKIMSLKLPLIVKPNYEGSSIGIDSSCFCATYKEATNKISELLKSFDEVLAEEYIEGYEVTVLVISKKCSGKILLNEPLSVAYDKKTYLTSEIFGAKEKYSAIRRYCLAECVLSQSTVEKIKQTSSSIVEFLKLPNFVRIDYRIRKENIYFLEINTNPAFGVTSDAGKLCELKNIPFVQFVNIFISSCLT